MQQTYFRWLGYVEGSSLLILLFVAMPLRALLHEPQIVKTVGSLHGVLFLMYVYTALTFAWDQKWPVGRTALALILSSVPFGTFWFDHRYLRKSTSAS